MASAAGEPMRKRPKNESRQRDLSCAWVLCRERSETMVPYLRLMGLNEMAIDAWIKAERATDTYKAIEFIKGDRSTPGGVRIRKRDRVQNGVEEFRFGVEVKTDCKVKGQHKRVVVTSQSRGHLLLKSELPLRNSSKCSLVETLRYLDGDLMHQELVARNLKDAKTSKQVVTINRYFTKTDSIPEDDEIEEEE